jgi:hypothetical protein
MRQQQQMFMTPSALIIYLSNTCKEFQTEIKLIQYLKEYINTTYYEEHRPCVLETRYNYVFKINNDNGSCIYTEAYSYVIEHMNKYPTATTELIRVELGTYTHKMAYRNTCMWFARESVKNNNLSFIINGQAKSLNFIKEWETFIEQTLNDN